RVWRQSTKGTYYVWDLPARRLIPVSAQPGYQMFAKLSPDGRMAAFVRTNNIYVTDLTTGAETAVTADGNDNVINGTSDWVYEEELDLRDAFRWSADGRRIAFWRLDQTAIRPFYLLNADSLYPELVPVRYPKAGMPNSEVKIGIVDLASRQTTWVDLGGDKDIYVAAMDFAGSSNEIWLTRLKRHQNRLDLLPAEPHWDLARAVLAWDRVRSDVPAVRRHIFARGHSPGPNPAAGGRHAGAHAGRQYSAGGEGGRAGAGAPGIHHDQDGRRRGAQRLDYQAAGLRSVPPLSAAHERVRRTGLPDRDRLLGRGELPVASDARARRLSRRECGQPWHGGARREVHEDDLPPPRPV